MRSCFVYFVLFIVPFAASAHGSRAVNIEANSVNKMTQAFVLSPRNERSEKKSKLLLSFCIYFSRDTTIWCLSRLVAWGISLVMDNLFPTGFNDRWKREKSGFSFVHHASIIDVHGCAIVPLVTRVPLLLCFMNNSCGPLAPGQHPVYQYFVHIFGNIMWKHEKLPP